MWSGRQRWVRLSSLHRRQLTVAERVAIDLAEAYGVPVKLVAHARELV